MTMRRRGGRRSSQRGPRRQTTWENLHFEHPHGTAGELVLTDLTPEPMAASLVGTATLIRCILSFAFGPDGSGTGTIWQRLAAGIFVCTADAFTAGAVPDPVSDFNQDWYYWTERTLFRPSTQTDAIDRWSVDIRSARRLRGGYKLVLASESPGANTFDTALWVTMRNLWQITS